MDIVQYLIIFLPLLFIILVGHLKSRATQSKHLYKLFNRFETFSFLTIIVVIIFQTKSFLEWWLNFDKNPEIQDYIQYTFYVISFSLLFSAVEYCLIVFDKNSVMLLNSFNNYLADKQTYKFNSLTEKYTTELDYIETLCSLLKGQHKLDLSTDNKANKKIRKQIISRFTSHRNGNDIIIYSTSIKSTFFVIHRRFYVQNSFSDYDLRIFIYQDLKLHSISSNTKEIKEAEIHLKNMTTEQGIIDFLLCRKSELESIMHYEKEIETEINVPIFYVMVNNIFELLSIRQGYIIPLSKIYILTHLIFGIYRLLFLGMLITLIFKH